MAIPCCNAKYQILYLSIQRTLPWRNIPIDVFTHSETSEWCGNYLRWYYILIHYVSHSWSSKIVWLGHIWGRVFQKIIPEKDWIAILPAEDNWTASESIMIHTTLLELLLMWIRGPYNFPYETLKLLPNRLQCIWIVNVTSSMIFCRGYRFDSIRFDWLESPCQLGDSNQVTNIRNGFFLTFVLFSPLIVSLITPTFLIFSC